MDNQSERKSCLVVDDVRASRELIKTWMSESGFRCEAATNGEDAWAAIVRSCPDVVFTDIGMPHGSGLDLLYTARTLETCPIRNVAVVVITAIHDDLLEKIVLDLGATAVLKKPLDKIATQAIVKQILDRPQGMVASRLPDLSSDGPYRCVSPTLRRLLSDIRAIPLRQHA